MSGPIAVLAFIGLGLPEILLVLLILVLIFGARRLPELGRGLGEGIKSFRGAVKELSDDAEDSNKPSGS